MWQDLVFLAGSASSLFVLLPTLRDATANVPLGTSLPSAVIGLVYGVTFVTLGMPLSAAGAFLAGSMWSLVVLIRSPHPLRDRLTERFGIGNRPAQTTHSGPQHAD